MKPSVLAALSLAVALATASAPALADDDDKAACADKAEGDACTRGDGDAGVCVPDDSDPVLTCEDDVGSTSGSGSTSGGSDDSSDDSSSGGCSAAGSPASPAGALALVGLALAAARSRRS